jgi:hypothetical protein
MRYYSKKSVLFILPIAVILLFLAISIADHGPVAILVLLFIVATYFVWTWFDTYYVIKDDKLFYKSALINGSINIDTIHEIVKGKTSFSGVKPALSTKGLIIKYNKWDDIYISPKDADLFINALKEINPDIQVSGK